MRFFTSPALLVALPSTFHYFTSAVSITTTGQTLVLNDVPYYLPAASFATLPFFTSLKGAASAVGFVPVTVVELSASNASQSGLKHVIDSFGADDVWNSGFLEGQWMFCGDVFLSEVSKLSSFIITNFDFVHHLLPGDL